MNIALIDPLEISEAEIQVYKQRLANSGCSFKAYIERSLDVNEIVRRAKEANRV